MQMEMKFSAKLDTSLQDHKKEISAMLSKQHAEIGTLLQQQRSEVDNTVHSSVGSVNERLSQLQVDIDSVRATAEYAAAFAACGGADDRVDDNKKRRRPADGSSHGPDSFVIGSDGGDAADVDMNDFSWGAANNKGPSTSPSKNQPRSRGRSARPAWLWNGEKSCAECICRRQCLS